MLSSLTTKLALRKVGLPSDALDFSALVTPPTPPPARQPNKLRKKKPTQAITDATADGGDAAAVTGWGAASWMSVKSLPLTVHPWLSPPPPPVEVARVPRVGDVAPLDRHGKLRLGERRRVLLVFLRCVGCAFAHKTFLNPRTLANRYAGSIACIAISHSSDRATRKWIDMLGGPWDVQVIIDEERAIYAAWGLGIASVWHVFNPTTQVQGWRETGWLGDKVAGAIQKGGRVSENEMKKQQQQEQEGHDDDDDDDGPSMELGNKWQENGAFAVDGRGTVVWGGKAMRADDEMDLEEGARLLLL